jgi:hypothetical protein
VLAAAIKAEIEASPKTCASEEDVAKAEGAKNKIAELRLAATKEGEAEYKPIYAQYTKLQKQWAAVVAPAAPEEKRITNMVLTFREIERKKAEAAKAEADRKAQDEFEANQRALDRAIVSGGPAPEPVIAEPPPVVSPAPPPAAAPTYGKRRVKAEVKPHIVAVTDWQALYTTFKDTRDVKVLLLTLATAAMRAGRTIPGVKIEDSLIAPDIEELLK